MQSHRSSLVATPSAHIAYIVMQYPQSSVTYKATSSVFEETKLFPDNPNLYVLPSGYLFHFLEIENEATTGTLDLSNTKRCTVLDSVLFDKRTGYIIVDDFIDPALSALTEDETSLKMVGVNKSRTEIFLYPFKNMSNKLEYQTNEVNREQITKGISIYKEKRLDKKIHYIGSCPDFNENHLIVAYQDGEILLCSITNSRLTTDFQLQAESKDAANISIQVSANDIVMAHYPQTNCVRIYDLPLMQMQPSDNRDAGINHYQLPSRLFSLQLSLDGKFFTGLKGDAQLSDTLCCYDLKSRTQQDIHFTKRISDFVISTTQMTGAITYEDASSGQKHLMQPGQLKTLLHKGIQPVKVDPKPRRLTGCESQLHRFLTRANSSDEDLNRDAVRTTHHKIKGISL